jgi:hypothetical protein
MSRIQIFLCDEEIEALSCIVSLSLFAYSEGSRREAM